MRCDGNMRCRRHHHPLARADAMLELLFYHSSFIFTRQPLFCLHVILPYRFMPHQPPLSSNHYCFSRRHAHTLHIIISLNGPSFIIYELIFIFTAKTCQFVDDVPFSHYHCLLFITLIFVIAHIAHVRFNISFQFFLSAMRCKE